MSVFLIFLILFKGYEDMYCDTEVHWHISHFCNFECPYCFGGKKQKDIFRGVQDIPKIIEGFNRFGLICQINISGGEPFLCKNFIELCQRLTEKHRICVNTNLSHKDVYRFAEVIDPHRVRYLNCSVHIDIREKLNLVDDFIEKFKFLKEKGFYAYATYVMYPPLLKRFDGDYAFFKSQGIILRQKIFRGTFNRFNLPDSWMPRRGSRFFKRLYPNAYSPRERKKILFYIERSQKEGDDTQGYEDDPGEGRMLDVGLDRFFLDGLPSLKGKLCRAGKDYVRMTPEGEVHRCHGGTHRLGNMFEEGVRLFEKPEECTFDLCRCHYLGYIYVVKEKK